MIHVLEGPTSQLRTFPRRLAAMVVGLVAAVSVAVATGLPEEGATAPEVELSAATDGIADDVVEELAPLPSRPTGPRPGGRVGGAGPGTTADGLDDFGACNEDGKSLCPQFYQSGYVARASWKLDLVACLGSHRSSLSEPCQASLDRRAQLNTRVNDACRTDRVRLCRGVHPQPGVEAGNACLREHVAEVTPECRDALDAHEAAKPQRNP